MFTNVPLATTAILTLSMLATAQAQAEGDILSVLPTAQAQAGGDTLSVLPTTQALVAGDAMGVGETAFFEHCAVCHGASGTGDGPFAPLLRAPPPDLTVLSQANGGEFPDSRVRRAVDGRGMPGAHGTAQMPIWGRVWHKAGEPEAGVRARLIAVIAYLLTIQK